MVNFNVRDSAAQRPQSGDYGLANTLTITRNVVAETTFNKNQD